MPGWTPSISAARNDAQKRSVKLTVGGSSYFKFYFLRPSISPTTTTNTSIVLLCKSFVKAWEVERAVLSCLLLFTGPLTLPDQLRTLR